MQQAIPYLHTDAGPSTCSFGNPPTLKNQLLNLILSPTPFPFDVAYYILFDSLSTVQDEHLCLGVCGLDLGLLFVQLLGNCNPLCLPLSA